jgi:hypothetical protein
MLAIAAAVSKNASGLASKSSPSTSTLIPAGIEFEVNVATAVM